MKPASFLTAAVVAASMTISAPVLAKKNLVFSGGPAGGTFQVVANAVQVYDPVKNSEKYRVRAQSSAGSVENLRKVNSGKAHFGAAGTAGADPTKLGFQVNIAGGRWGSPAGYYPTPV